MQDRDPHSAKKRPDNSPSPLAETPLESSGEFVVEHRPIPPKGPADKKIHPRRPLPLVPNAPPEQKKEGKKDA
jgi:hypothetical protein